MDKLVSDIDASVNYIQTMNGSTFESRFVQRDKEYFIVYLSAQAGCKQACRMCHLTQTKQFDDTDATVPDMLRQADVVLNDMHPKVAAEATKVHYNFMARGEPLASEVVQTQFCTLAAGLSERGLCLGLKSSFQVSTIMPKAFINTEFSLQDVFGDTGAVPYYSLYSLNENVRRKWLPKAADPDTALRMLKAYQDAGVRSKIHFAFIEGVNDTETDMAELSNKLIEHELDIDLNVVRYNPHDATNSKEPSETQINNLVETFRSSYASSFPGCIIQVVPKVGFDVQASCGMFVNSRGS